MYLHHLTNDELVRQVYAQVPADPLALELAQRLEACEELRRLLDAALLEARSALYEFGADLP